MSEQFKDIIFNSSPNAPNIYSYLPLKADVERDPSGKALVSLTQMGNGAHLMFATHWQANVDDVETLRAMLAERGGRTQPVQLSCYELRDPTCRILIGDGKGNFSELATSKTAGYPPFNSVFNVVLDSETTLRVHAAMNGQMQWLAFEYVAKAYVPVGANGRITIETGRLVEWFTQQGWQQGEAISEDMIERAVASGLIDILIVSDNTPPADMHAIRSRLLQRASDLLTDQLATADAGTRGAIQVGIQARDLVAEPVRVFADIGALIAPTIH